jgi:hypothetical protein
MNFYYIELNKDTKNRLTYLLCCEYKDLKIRLEDEFECIEAIDHGNGEWQLKGMDQLSKDYELCFDENASKKICVTKLTKKELEEMFSSIITVYRKNKTSSIFSNLFK